MLREATREEVEMMNQKEKENIKKKK